MKIIDLKKHVETDRIDAPLCLILGNFDGVHQGHARLAELALEESKKKSLKTAAWTFEQHPLYTLTGAIPPYLTDIEEKNEIFSSLGLDYIIYEDFVRVKDMFPQDFVKEILTKKVDCRTAVCGFNFKFAKNGVGDPTILREMMEKSGRSVIVADAVNILGKTVSSTAVRTLLEEGNTEDAAKMLGRPYSVTLPVVMGKQLGRTIGIPTVNQRFPLGRTVPKKGIYVCKCLVDGKEYPGVANIGSRPTVNADGNDINCETHIIGYSGELYGEKVTVSFFKRIRDEIKFPCLQELKKAVEKDINFAVEYFSKNKGFDKK